jgi:hypothetical protein
VLDLAGRGLFDWAIKIAIENQMAHFANMVQRGTKNHRPPSIEDDDEYENDNLLLAI